MQYALYIHTLLYPLLLVLGLVGNALCLVTFAGAHLRPKTRALCCLLCTMDSFISFERLLALHYPQNSSTVLLRSRCCLVGMCIVLALVLVNSLPLVELSLITRITLSAASADGSDGPDGMSNSTKGPIIALEHSDAGTTFQVVAESIPPIYKDGAIDEYANEHTLLTGSCELEASGSPGTAPYWKLVDLVVYSMGPFLATFLVNTAIIVGIYRARRLQSQFLSTPRVRFLTNPNCREEEENAM